MHFSLEIFDCFLQQMHGNALHVEGALFDFIVDGADRFDWWLYGGGLVSC